MLIPVQILETWFFKLWKLKKMEFRFLPFNVEITILMTSFP